MDVKAWILVKCKSVMLPCPIYFQSNWRLIAAQCGWLKEILPMVWFGRKSWKTVIAPPTKKDHRILKLLHLD